MIYSNCPYFMNPTGWLSGSINKLSDGFITIINLDGTVLSVQPDGSYQSRPSGTAGPYEIGRVEGDKLVYTPGGVSYVIATVGM